MGKIVFILLLLNFYNVCSVWSQDDSEENAIVNRADDEQLIKEEKYLSFKQNFMDAMQHRATENYKKALELLQICEGVYPENTAMLFEIAKNNFSLGRDIDALQYCDRALAKEPHNFWVRKLKKDIYIKQQNLLEALEIQKLLYAEKPSEAENLLEIFYRLKDYEKGKNLLEEIDKKVIYVEKIKMFRNFFEKAQLPTIETEMENPDNNGINETSKITDSKAPQTDLKSQLDQINKLAVEKNYDSLLIQTQRMLEIFPTESLAYYYNGLALNGLKKYKDGIVTLENGLDFVFDDAPLLKKYYNELIIAYAGMGNTAKANMYKQLVQKLK